jgi:hypothetical protein
MLQLAVAYQFFHVGNIGLLALVGGVFCTGFLVELTPVGISEEQIESFLSLSGRLGGFVFDSNIETYTEKGSKLLKYKVNTADAHQITPEILADITGKLTKEQMGFVDEMQDYGDLWRYDKSGSGG